tara:strand:- start:3903 stop:4883 length:981 start_codon:yes stop_codon:yes gene_type:complete
MNIRIESPREEILSEAVAILHSGGVVGIPTETVYGLGASTTDPDAIRSIYRIKGRPSDNPLIAHVSDTDAARSIADGWDERCDRLAEAFWPGPLTLVLGRSDGVPAIASGGRGTIAIRCPRHPVARSLLTGFGGPISAPSANRSGSVSPTTAQHVLEDFAPIDDPDELLVLDGGPCGIGIESTVIDLTGDTIRVLRPGSISRDRLEEEVGAVHAHHSVVQGDSPGTRSRHYSTRTPIRIVGSPSELREVASNHERVAVISTSDDAGFDHVFRLPGDPVGYAEGMYAAMREADEAGAELIIMECPGEGPSWSAIRDRLSRAESTGDR